MRNHAENIDLDVGAGVAISRLIDNYETLLKQLENEGYKRVTFAYPSEPMHSSYLATTNEQVSHFSSEELVF